VVTALSLVPDRTGYNCRDCKHFRSTMVFDLCKRPESTYTAGGKTDQHTTGHMRAHACGPDARLFEPKDLPFA
jgi:hypothetical protein